MEFVNAGPSHRSPTGTVKTVASASGSLVILMVMTLIPVTSCSAQNWDEFFSQGEMQKQYDKEQRTALSFGWARTVYIKNAIYYGLDTYIKSEQGNLNLTRDFFGRLNNVSPEVMSSAKVIDIMVFQYYLTRDMGKVYAFCSSNSNFTAQEIRYVEKVHANFLVITDANVSELIRIIAPGQTTMTDEERLGQVNKIYEEQLEQQAFVREFGDDVFELSRQRAKEARETKQ